MSADTPSTDTPSVEQVLLSFQGQPASWRTHHQVEARLREVLSADPDFKNVDVAIYPWSGDALSCNVFFQKKLPQHVTLPGQLLVLPVWRVRPHKADLDSRAEPAEQGAGKTAREALEDAFEEISRKFRDGAFEGYAIVDTPEKPGSPRYTFKVKAGAGPLQIEDASAPSQSSAPT